MLALVRALPDDALFRHALQAEYQKTLIPTPDKIRARQDHYARLAAKAAETEGGDSHG